MLEIPDIFLGRKADAGSEPTYAEKMRVPPLWGSVTPSDRFYCEFMIHFLVKAGTCTAIVVRILQYTSLERQKID